PLKNCVPVATGAGGFALASITKTSSSGSVNLMTGSQDRASRSSQCPLTGLNLTTRPTSGPFTPWTLVSGFGVPGRPVEHVAGAIVLLAEPDGSSQGPASLIDVVRFPEWNTAAYTRVPLAFAASARGVSPKNVTFVSGAPPRLVPRFVASNTQTSARPRPSVVRSVGGTPLFCPRCAVVMKARFPPIPAKTMSRGSSPTSRGRTTRGGFVPPATRPTLSQRRFTST